MLARLVGSLRLLLFAAVTAALVATSPPEDEAEVSDRTWATLKLEGELSLTGALPSRTLAFRVFAAQPHFSSLQLVLVGDIEHSGQASNGDAGALADFVEIELISSLQLPPWQAAGEQDGFPKQTVLTQFELTRSGELPHDCTENCSADILAHFERLDAGVFGADAQVRWRLAVTVLIPNDVEDAGLKGWSLEAIDLADTELRPTKDVGQ